MEGRVFCMEFPSLDVDRATRFWNGVMGWNFGSGVFEQFDYRMAQRPTRLDVSSYVAGV